MIMLIGLNACTIFSNPSPSALHEEITLAPPLGPTRHIVQKIIAQWPGHQEQFIAVLELDRHRIALAGITPGGMSLFNLSFDGKHALIEKSPMLPLNFSPNRIIRDIQMAYWPLDELSKTLGTHWRMQDSQKKRLIYLDDALQYDISYSSPGNIWAGDVDLNHLSEHYRLQISTVQLATVSE